MSSVEFQTLALVVLVAAGVTISWIMYLDRDERQEAARSALAGVGHELRLTIQRFMAELGPISRGQPASAGDLMPIRHPQMDSIFAHPIRANRNALSVFGATYLSLESRKLDLKSALSNGTVAKPEVEACIETLIDAIVTLYLWEEHGGARPVEAESTRSWHVRDWMKRHNFRADAFPDRHLRDEVVERLRQLGMTLTPAPLTHTAHEYYSMRYDRKADPRGPFGRRYSVRKASEVPDSGGFEGDGPDGNSDTSGPETGFDRDRAPGNPASNPPGGLPTA
ncbi:MAG: hypothetical protein AAGJ32_11700 [Pseudomonadota bacterium]